MQFGPSRDTFGPGLSGDSWEVHEANALRWSPKVVLPLPPKVCLDIGKEELQISAYAMGWKLSQGRPLADSIGADA